MWMNDCDVCTHACRYQLKIDAIIAFSKLYNYIIYSSLKFILLILIETVTECRYILLYHFCII